MSANSPRGLSAEVTVIMPAYNAAPYVEEAVRSILDQQDVALRLIVVDDGSTDGTGDIVEAVRDPRISLIRNDENAGISACLNEVLGAPKTAFVARMDADDVAVPQRLARQIRFLRGHREIDVVSSTLDSFGAGRPRKVLAQAYAGLSPDALRWSLLVANPIANPAVCARADAFVRGGSFDTAFEPAEDYEYWCRNRNTLRFAILPEPLVRHRRHAGAVSEQRVDDQIRSVNLTHRRMVQEELGRTVREEECSSLRWHWRESDPERLDAASALLLELEAHELARPNIERDFGAWLRADVNGRLRAIWYRIARATPRRTPTMLARWLARERLGAIRSVLFVPRPRHIPRTPNGAGAGHP